MSEYDYLQVARDVLEFSRERGYAGYDKHDGMSSRLLQRFPFDYPLVNLCVQESIKRSPVNIRPLFAVERRQSPIGLSLFTMSNRALYEMTGESAYLDDAEYLITRVAEYGTNGSAGFALPHNHELQRIGKKIPRGTPRVVATTWGVRALIEMSDRDPTLSGMAESVTSFVEQQLNPERDEDGHIRVKYKPTDDASHYTLNANAVTARMYTHLYTETENEEYLEFARDVLRYVATCQEDVGGWMYRDPPSASHLSMDNYHNGYIIEAYLKLKEVIDSTEFDDMLEDALSFYRNHLFEADGAPNWDEDSTYPRDICAVSQGAVVFTIAGDLDFAKRILDWALEHLYAGDGRFYYQKKRFYTKKFTLMRWCQAWMAYALTRFIVAKSKNPERENGGL